MRTGRRIADESGQGTVEWMGLILLVSLAMAALAALAGLSLPGAVVARAVAERLICAVGLGDCAAAPGSLLDAAYGDRVAATVRDLAPEFLYEESMTELPVDYRRCRDDPCSNGSASAGEVAETVAGLRATAFVHVVDCRPDAIEATQAQGLDCSGERAGRLYVQYWAYYPDSQTDPFGERGYHRDDWESFQVKVAPGESLARASSHHSYNYAGGPLNWVSDTGIDPKPGWGPYEGTYHVSAGSHAGHVDGDPDEPMWTPGAALTLIPIEPIAAAGTDDALFAVTPPWLKDVYSDPESERT